jgi:hypothetical protein
MIGSDNALRTIRTHLLVPAIVQQNHIPTPNLLANFSLDHSSRRRIPVVPGDVPHHRYQPELASNAQHSRPPPPERWTKKIGHLHASIPQRSRALSKLTSDLSFALENQQRMSLRMISNRMSRLRNLAHDIRPLSHIASDQKKSRAHSVPGKNIEQSQRMPIVWAIIVSKRQLSRTGSKACECFPVPLRSRHHRLIACGNGRSRANCSSGKSEHVRILKDFQFSMRTTVREINLSSRKSARHPEVPRFHQRDDRSPYAQSRPRCS